MEFLFILYNIKTGDAIFSYGFQYNEDGENASESINAQELTLD